MNGKRAFFIAILALALPLLAWAQAPQAPQEPQDQEGEGRVWGNYDVHQSIEFGGHIAESEGNQQMYRTFVNIDSGPRLLGQELTMRSRAHQGVLFDSLYVSSFGFGGDPENMARLRIQKDKWYNFVGLYRRDENFFDYDLFANPLQANAGANFNVPFVGNTTYTGAATLNGNYSPQAVPWFSNSPHLQNTTRNMGDFTLTLLPESVVSFRLGYARNATHGRLDTTVSTSAMQSEDSWWRSDRYQFGVDIKYIPRTTISGDVFFEHDKNDFGFFDNNRLFTLQGTTLPVDIGPTFFPFYGPAPSGTNANVRCLPAATQIIPSPGVFVLNTSCTGAILQYLKQGNVSTDIPTGQLSLQSGYFHNLDITASGTYSSASSDFLKFREFNYGFSPTMMNGPASTDRISANADLGLTYHIGRNWSVSDKFRWVNWREPGSAALATFTCSHAGGSTLLSAFLNPCGQATDLFGLIAATNPGASLAGNAATGNFESITASSTLLGERSYFNTVKVNWQPNWHISGYLGYRFGRRELKLGEGVANALLTTGITITNVCQLTGAPAGCTTASISPFDLEEERIDMHTALLGVVVRPTQQWRINGDVELLYADNAFTNISPRHQQRFRVYTTYRPKDWLSLNAGIHFVETRNDFGASDTTVCTAGPPTCVLGATVPLFPAGVISPYGHKDHWRYYTLGASLTPNTKFTLDLGWTLLDQVINSATCMPLPTIAFGVASPLGTPTTLNCANSPAVGATTNWSTSFARALLLHYDETTNSFYTFISYHPIRRVTFNLGYELTADDGATNWLRFDTGAPLMVVGDRFGNVPYIAANLTGGCPAGIGTVAVTGGTACLYPGPFPDQPLGPQAINWHKGSAGITVELTKGVEFKGVWNYYDYNGKDHPASLFPLLVTQPRDFHANVGTLALRYSF